MIDIEQLLYEEESTTLDFKKEQYRFIKASDEDKSELLKDILAFSNAFRRVDAYILIGVEEIKGGKSIIHGIKEEDTIDDAALQQFVNQKVQRPITFHYKSITVDNKLIGVIHIPINERPFYLKKDYGKLKKEEVYIRRGSSTDKASIDEIANMQKQTSKIENIPILNLSFANNKEKKELGINIEINSIYLNIIDKEDIPDYTESNKHDLFRYDLFTINKNYYRKLIDYYFYSNAVKPISFCLYNDSSILATDIKIEIIIHENVVLVKEEDFIEKPERSTHNYFDARHLNNKNLLPDIIIEKRNEKWYIELLFKKVQAKQRIFTKNLIYIGFNGEIEFTYKIFADNIPHPQEGILKIKQNAENITTDYKKILEEDAKLSLEEIESINKVRTVTINLDKGKNK